MPEPQDDLVAALAAVGDSLDAADPAGPDPVAAAVRRIAAAPVASPVRLGRRAAWRVPRRRAVVLAAAALVVAAVVAVPGSRASVARLLGIGGVRIVTTADDPTDLSDLAVPYELGDPVDVEGAIERAPGRVVPRGLGPPDAAYAGEPTGAVTVLWRARGDLPPIDPGPERGVGLVVTAIPGPIGEPVVIKEVGPATHIGATTVAGHRGYWISGGPHVVRGAGGSGGVADVVRLAGNTLLWTDGEVTYRLESALGRDDAVALAERLAGRTPAG